jgi:outer membrane protein assembly factor BamB
MDQPELLYAGVGRTVVAMDRFTGRPVWRLKLPRLLGGHISMILPHADEVYVGRGGYVYCIDRFKGNVLWERGTQASGNFVLLAVAGEDAAQQQAAAMHAMMAEQAAATAAGAAAAASAG